MNCDSRDTTTISAQLAAAVAHLRAGEAVIFPTDTVAGIGVAVDFAPDPQKLYAAKLRDAGKPIAWLVGSVDDMQAYGADVPEYAFDLARQYWPGALTLVVKAAPSVPAAFASAQGTIGLRMPDHDMACSLICQVGCPLATSSANLSGAQAPGSSQAVEEALRQAAAYCIEGGAQATGRASTVLDCTGPVPKVLREGDISAAQLALQGYTCA